MKSHTLPFVLALTVLAVIVYVLNSASSSKKTFGPAQLEQLADIDGIETEVALAPDGTRLVAVSSGDLWLLDTASGSREQLTFTPEAESSPAWDPGGRRLTFTRGRDTFAAEGDLKVSAVFKENATSLSWSGTGRMAFVRERGLWLTDAAGLKEQEIVSADPSPNVYIRSPHFSPDSLQLAFIKASLGPHGEVWLADATNGTSRAVVADRPAEDPMDLGWLDDGKLIYLTNRSGAYALWVINFSDNSARPLTNTLFGIPLKRIGISVSKDRILLPRHLVDSDIVLSDGTGIAQTEDLEFEPTVSPNEKIVAYTVQKDSMFEIWTAGLHGENPRPLTPGTEPRFGANDFKIVYTYTDVQGRVDLREIDVRDGRSESLTDAIDIDSQPDWSPDGRTIVFASGLRGDISLWTLSAGGGKRLPLGNTGYYPRFSPDGRFILFWDQEIFWSIPAEGGRPRPLRNKIPGPVPAILVKGVPRYFEDPDFNRGNLIWPEFDVLKDGRIVFAPIEVRGTSLWAVNLTYVPQ